MEKIRKSSIFGNKKYFRKKKIRRKGSFYAYFDADTTEKSRKE